MRHLRRPLDLVLDLFLYIPVGAVVQARTVLPELAEAGRDHLARRAELVRAIGSFVAAQAPGAPRPTPRAHPGASGSPGHGRGRRHAAERSVVAGRR